LERHPDHRALAARLVDRHQDFERGPRVPGRAAVVRSPLDPGHELAGLCDPGVLIAGRDLLPTALATQQAHLLAAYLHQPLRAADAVVLDLVGAGQFALDERLRATPEPDEAHDRVFGADG